MKGECVESREYGGASRVLDFLFSYLHFLVFFNYFFVVVFVVMSLNISKDLFTGPSIFVSG